MNGNRISEIARLNKRIVTNEIDIDRIHKEFEYNKNQYTQLCELFEENFENYSDIDKLHYSLMNPNRSMSRKYIRNNYKIHLRRKMHDTHVTIKIDPHLLSSEYDIIKCYDSFNCIINYYGYPSCEIKVMGTCNSVMIEWDTTNIAKLIINKSENHKITIKGSTLDILKHIKSNVDIPF